MVLYTLTAIPFYDSIQQCYRKVLTINIEPVGPLKSLTKRTIAPKLSPFQERNVCCPTSNCIYIIMSPTNPSEYLCINDIGQFFSYLVTNGYTIDTSITKMMNESDVKIDNSLLCFISYP
jgi:hypothetical protein